MSKVRDRLEVCDFQGSAYDCGRAYGRWFEPMILGFCAQQVNPNPKRLAYARQCWKHVQRDAPTSAAFLRGLSAGSGLPLDHATLVTLHEETVHFPHCTGFVAARDATRGGQTIVAQNWDWAPQLYPWAGLMRLRLKGDPKLAVYHYPGLWVCAGVNSDGLALMWTGAGYLPKVTPVVGLPTYVLIAEIMRRSTVTDALKYLRSVRRAGSFIFLLGDAGGSTAVVEATPHCVVVEENGSRMHRANHYICAATKRDAKQALRGKQITTVARERRIHRLLNGNGRALTGAAVRAMLTDRGSSWPWLHQYPAPPLFKLNGMTIDSLYATCQRPALWASRGGRQPGPWHHIRP